MYKSSKVRTTDYLANFNDSQLLKTLITKKNPLCVDVGANVGQTANRLKKIWPNAELHCIEPLLDQYIELKKVSQNYTNVHVYHHALGPINGPKEFYINKHQVMLSSFYPLNENSRDSIALNNPEPGHANFLDSEKTIVECCTLDTWAQANKVVHIDLLKLDTQGSEPEILENGKVILEHTDVVITELMFYDLYKKKNSFYDIESILLPLGFELFDIGYISKNPMTGRTDWVDVIYRKN